MVHLTVTVALLLLACVHAAPAPVPGNPKLTFVKDSSLGLGLAGAGGKSNGVLEGNKAIETPIEAPLPGNTGDNLPDVTVLDNVNAGAAVAIGGSVSTGVLKNNKFADNTFPW